MIRESTEQAHEAYESLTARTERGPTPRDEFRGAIGTPTEVAETIEAYDELGVSQYLLKAPKNDRRSLELFIDDVKPEFE